MALFSTGGVLIGGGTGVAAYTVMAAQIVPFDPASLYVYGPLGIFCAWLIYNHGKAQERAEKREDALKVEMVAERAGNSRLQDERLADQRALIPLAATMSAQNAQNLETLKDLSVLLKELRDLMKDLRDKR